MHKFCHHNRRHIISVCFIDLYCFANGILSTDILDPGSRIVATFQIEYKHKLTPSIFNMVYDPFDSYYAVLRLDNDFNLKILNHVILDLTHVDERILIEEMEKNLTGEIYNLQKVSEDRLCS